MAFDVLKTPTTNFTSKEVFEYPYYHFYSSKKGRYVSVTLKEDGDNSSEFNSIVDAVRYYNNLSYDPEIEIRNDTSRSPYDKTYAFKINKKPNTELTNSFEIPIQYNNNSAIAVNKLRIIQNIVNISYENNGITKADYRTLLSVIRSLNITNLDSLNSYFPIVSISIESFLNTENLKAMDTQDLLSLRNQVPELGEYIDFNNIAFVNAQQINNAIDNIPDLRSKLGLEFSFYDGLDLSDIRSNLADLIKNIPNIGDFSSELSSTGKEFFPDGINTPDIVNSNLTHFDEQPVTTNVTNDINRVDDLFKTNNAFFNPLEEILKNISSVLNSINDEIQTLLAQQTIKNAQEIINSLNGDNNSAGINETIGLFTKHIENIVNYMPVEDNVIINSSSIDTINSLISDPLQGLSSTQELNGRNLAGVFEASKSYIASQASTQEADYDGLDPKSGFNFSGPEPVLGSLLSQEYHLLLQELLVILKEIINFKTTPTIMNNSKNTLSPRLKDIEELNKFSTLISDYNVTELLTAFTRAINYFSERGKDSIPLNAKTLDQKYEHIENVGIWVPIILNYYTQTIMDVVLGEINGYRYAYNNSQKQNFVDKTKSSAMLVNSIMTPEFNQAINHKKDFDDNIIRTTVPTKRLPLSSFPKGYSLSQFVDIEIDKAANRLRNYERDYMGEINVITANDLYDNLKALTENILIPLKDYGFKFDIIRGMRPFNYTRDNSAEFNNSDHHYGLAVDIRLKNVNLTNLAAIYIKKYLPWNKLIIFNYNQGSKANTNAYIHISHYWKVTHGWDKNHSLYPPGNGLIKQIGGNGMPIPNLI